MEPEKTIHQTSPSQIVNLKFFLVCGLLAAGIIVLSFVLNNPVLLVFLLVPFAYAWWKWMLVKSMKLTLTDQRLIVSQGVFNKVTNETELYRVRDTSIEEPFFYRMFSVGNIVVYSTDEAEGKLLFTAFRKPHWIKDQIRNYAEICRKNRRWGNDNVLIHEHQL
ncbi:PH domain-containing protein [Flavisolibacter nicotianae]|uniref:PH domain-containing protein n=1 Tax=Flavisolibacter nicotianae TaxID=2364882 RepID=UPI000EB55A3C|nr:PH domain-containing protein [Flavisolibacter nicotianae]